MAITKKRRSLHYPLFWYGGILEPEDAFNIVNTMNCEGFVSENEKGYTINWLFGKVSKTEEMVIVYEIKKPLLRDVKVVERFPPTTLITRDVNSVSVEWHTKENYLSPTLTYNYEWDTTTIILMLFSLIFGVGLDKIVSLIMDRRKTVILNTVSNTYHTSRCNLAKKIDPDKKKTISKKEAISKNYDSCGMCRP